MNESQHESSSDEKDIEIINLDAQRPRRFSSTRALRRGAPYLWWAAWISSLLLLVLLIGPGRVLLLLRSQDQQPLRIDGGWASGHDLFLVADQTAIYLASRDSVLEALRTKTGRLLWHVTTDGPVSGKPVIVGGAVYASSQTTVYAIKASTGLLLWRQTPEESVLQGQPVVGAGIVSIALANGSLAAWRASDGRPLWDASLKDEALYPVAIGDGLVLADTSRGSIVAVGAMTGVLLWKHAAMTFAPQLPTTASSMQISFALPSGTLAGMQTEDGRLLWRHDFSTAAILQGGALAIAEGDGLVYVSQQNKSAPGGSLTVLRANTGKLLWQCATGTGFIPPLVVSGVVYIGSQYGPLEARRIDDGSLLWRYLPESFPLVVVTVAQDRVYLGSAMGTFEAVGADTGTLRWRYDADGPISDVTQDAHGVVFIGAGNGFIAGLREDTGTRLWQFLLSGMDT